jgi:hypothetical protein
MTMCFVAAVVELQGRLFTNGELGMQHYIANLHTRHAPAGIGKYSNKQFFDIGT